MKLSVVVPVFNEKATVAEIIDRIRATNLSIELIVVDDGSTDGTRDVLKGVSGKIDHLLLQDRNAGKGAALKAGFAVATGDVVIIQDADLEYDPQDYIPMLRALLDGRADIVYGSRYLGRGRHDNQSLAAYLGGRSLSLVAWLFTGTFLTDTVTAFKLFRRQDIAALPLETSGFELDHEITSRMLARGKTIVEVPIRYYPRSREEGKKIGLRDWFIGTRTFWRYRNG
jgi:glycosyltransferase involved in cell wall biosynthesis